MKPSKVFSLYVLALCGALILVTQFQSRLVADVHPNKTSCVYSSTFGDLTEEKTTKETTLVRITQTENVVAINSWDLGKKEYLCVVTHGQIRVGDDFLPNRQLGFFEKVGDRLIKKYRYETGNWFSSLYPLRDWGGNLLTIWGGGVAYHFVIFSMLDNKLHVVLEDGSYFMPDIIDIDADGEQEILVTKGKFTTTMTNQMLFPEGRQIYKWDGKEYRLIGTLPWMRIIEGLPYRK